MQQYNNSVELQKLIENIKGIYDSKNLLDILTDFERVLDNLDVYAYKNWRYGELAEGPISSRHWVTAKFIWPKKLAPDPLFINRLVNNGVDCNLYRAQLVAPVKVEDYEDFEPGKFYPKKEKHPIWVIEICIPKHMIETVEKGYVEMSGENVDLAELTSAYEQDLDNEGVVKQGDDYNE